MEFEFDKFNLDLEKREKINNDRRKVENHIREEDERRRLRNFYYNEKWQNRIVWKDRG
tara:strand:- start:776 stop:949 length:174 start_codon:yes stop_codon:yes gene_type:complete